MERRARPGEAARRHRGSDRSRAGCSGGAHRETDGTHREGRSYCFKMKEDTRPTRRTVNNDCGATSHMINDFAKFKTVDKNFKPKSHVIELADGTKATGVTRGEAEVTLIDSKGRKATARLKRALYIPVYPCISPRFLRTFFPLKQPQATEQKSTSRKVKRCFKKKRIHTEVQSPGAAPSEKVDARPSPPTRLTTNNFVFHKVMGKGQAGTVLLAELKGTGQIFAVKAVKKDETASKALTEKRVLALIAENPFFVHLYSTFQTKDYLFFVMECLSGGDLLFHLKNSRRFNLKRTTFYAAEMVVGLQFLHSRGIVHRDLKPGNMMLDGEGHIKIVDFGLCKKNIFGRARATSPCGTPAFIAPEILLGQRYTSSVDWWSFGVTVYFMLTGYLPFMGRSRSEMFQAIKTGDLEFPLWMNEETKDLLKELLERDPRRRLGVVGDIRAHRFFKDIDWAALEKREVEPPFKPKRNSPDDFCNTSLRMKRMKPSLSHDYKDQAALVGFSFISPKLERMLDQGQDQQISQ